jgi:hypothetical protein
MLTCFQNSCTSGSCLPWHLIMQIGAGLFFGILFLQSGWDKADDWQGNLSWMKEHFQKTFFGKATPLLLGMLTAMELSTGTISVCGVILLVWKGCSFWLSVGLTGAMASLLALFAGQRFAKDYAGAASLVPYLIMALLGLWIVG